MKKTVRMSEGQLREAIKNILRESLANNTMSGQNEFSRNSKVNASKFAHDGADAAEARKDQDRMHKNEKEKSRREKKEIDKAASTDMGLNKGLKEEVDTGQVMSAAEKEERAKSRKDNGGKEDQANKNEIRRLRHMIDDYSKEGKDTAELTNKIKSLKAKMNENKNTIKLNEEQFRQMIKESVRGMLNEGPGAGYTVKFDGLQASNFQIVKNDGEKIYFKGQITPSVVEWSAIGYYGGPSNEGVWYDNDLVQEYDDEDNTVQGGSLEGYVYVEDVADYNGNVDEQEILGYISDCLAGFGFEQMYGGGYCHADLGNPIVFNDVEVEVNYTTFFIEQIQIDAPNITANCNWWFEHWCEFDKIFGPDADEEEIPEEGEDMYESRNSIKMNESQLREAIKGMLREYGNTPEGQKMLGALAARKILHTPGEDKEEYLDNLHNTANKFYDYAANARGGDEYNELGDNANPMYKDYTNGYIEYMNSHPEEYMDDERRRQELGVNETVDFTGDPFDKYNPGAKDFQNDMSWNEFDSGRLDDPMNGSSRKAVQDAEMRHFNTPIDGKPNNWGNMALDEPTNVRDDHGQMSMIAQEHESSLNRKLARAKRDTLRNSRDAEFTANDINEAISKAIRKTLK